MPNKPTRSPLTRERVLDAAVGLADQRGLGALTMRRLGAELGVEAMSLYKHVSNKDEILDGILDVVIGEIAIPAPGAGWREAMRLRANSARDVLSRHSWAIGLLEARATRGPATLRYLDAILGSLKSAGFPIRSAAHAFWLLDSYVYGHVIQETSLPSSTSDGMTATAESAQVAITAADFPHLVEAELDALANEYSFDGEFEFGLELILDGLARQLGPTLHENE